MWNNLVQNFSLLSQQMIELQPLNKINIFFRKMSALKITFFGVETVR